MVFKLLHTLCALIYCLVLCHHVFIHCVIRLAITVTELTITPLFTFLDSFTIGRIGLLNRDVLRFIGKRNIVIFILFRDRFRLKKKTFWTSAAVFSLTSVLLYQVQLVFLSWIHLYIKFFYLFISPLHSNIVCSNSFWQSIINVPLWGSIYIFMTIYTIFPKSASIFLKVVLARFRVYFRAFFSFTWSGVLIFG